MFAKFHARVNSRISKMSTQKVNRLRAARVTPPHSPGASTSCSPSTISKEEEEICPICLLEMAEGESLTICKGGCNNRLHQHCMEVCELSLGTANSVANNNIKIIIIIVMVY